MKDGAMVFAVSGVKNSGKTWLITQMIPLFLEKGYKVATIKHDGHGFASNEGTDTFLHREAGAYGTAVFNSNQIMVMKNQNDPTEEELFSYFPEADVIILEGFKHSKHPKIEVVRQGNSSQPVCDPKTVIAYVTNIKLDTFTVIISPDNPQRIVEEVEKYFN